jgi:glycosyltransferase involved in cell wall biosynthesis
MEILHIITRCTRPANLLQIKESIINAKGKFNVIWHIIFDTTHIKDIDVSLLGCLQSEVYNLDLQFIASTKGAYGYDSINKIVAKLPNQDPSDKEWFYLLDDDNILHEDFHTLVPIIESNPDKGVIVFNQYVGGKDFSKLEYRVASKENTKIGSIDAAQYIIRRKHLSWPTGNSYALDYCADGILLEFLIVFVEDSFLFVDIPLCNYNHIQAIPKNFSLPRILLISPDKEVILKSNNNPAFEAVDMNMMVVPSDNNINSDIASFNPDGIITIGESDSNHFNMLNMSYHFRKRWLNFKSVDEIGGYAYNCANNYILTGLYQENPLVSFFTPIYNTGDILYRTYESLKNQTYKNWEWCIVNDSSDGGKTLLIAEKIATMDARVRVYDFAKKSGGIVGESKYRAACLSQGVYLMEMDHDDVLTPDAAELMVRAFKENPDCKFVYSDCAEVKEDNTCIVYGEGAGLGYCTYRKEDYNGITYDVMNTSNINPKTIRHIVGVPNHFRAWDRVFYHSIGGHNRNLTIADDYELIVRTFLKTIMIRIPKLLYLQYYHSNNTQNMTRSDIQRRVRSIRDHYNESIHQRFLELGKVDFAYDICPHDPTQAPCFFGPDENAVNKIMIL